MAPIPRVKIRHAGLKQRTFVRRVSLLRQRAGRLLVFERREFALSCVAAVALDLRLESRRAPRDTFARMRNAAPGTLDASPKLVMQNVSTVT